MPKQTNNKDKKVKESKKREKKEKRHFFKDVKAELKKVIWPTPKQLINNTVAVIVIVLIVGAIVFLLDLCFEQLNSRGIEQLKSIVQSEETNMVVENVESNTTANETNVEANSEVESTENTVEENTETTDNAENTESAE